MNSKGFILPSLWVNVTHLAKVGKSSAPYTQTRHNIAAIAILPMRENAVTSPVMLRLPTTMDG